MRDLQNLSFSKAMQEDKRYAKIARTSEIKCSLNVVNAMKLLEALRKLQRGSGAERPEPYSHLPHAEGTRQPSLNELSPHVRGRTEGCKSNSVASIDNPGKGCAQFVTRSCSPTVMSKTGSSAIIRVSHKHGLYRRIAGRMQQRQLDQVTVRCMHCAET